MTSICMFQGTNAKGVVQKKNQANSYHINPLSPNSDQHQNSPCNINAYSTPEVMRMKDMITRGEFS